MCVLSMTLCDDILLHSLGFCFTFPMDQTVSAYDIAFFPCEIPGRGQPLWVINTTQFYPNELIPDHATNISGLVVFARPEYNNTIYRCRFINMTFDELGFLDEDEITTPPAVLIVINDGENQHII